VAIDRASSLVEFLTSRADALCHVEYWREVARIWAATAPGDRDGEAWYATWRRAGIAPGAQPSLMTTEERAALAALPPHVTIHRAFRADDWRGLAWVLERADAARLAPDGEATRLATATVARARIVALFGRTGVREVVVLPDGLDPVIARLG
jgi:hypothetical protein